MASDKTLRPSVTADGRVGPNRWQNVMNTSTGAVGSPNSTVTLDFAKYDRGYQDLQVTAFFSGTYSRPTISIRRDSYDAQCHAIAKANWGDEDPTDVLFTPLSDLAVKDFSRHSPGDAWQQAAQADAEKMASDVDNIGRYLEQPPEVPTPFRHVTGRHGQNIVAQTHVASPDGVYVCNLRRNSHDFQCRASVYLISATTGNKKLVGSTTGIEEMPQLQKFNYSDRDEAGEAARDAAYEDALDLIDSYLSAQAKRLP
jgi:hypothetical protein